MRGRTRRATAIGAAAFALAGSVALGMPGTASAATKTVSAPCGSTVTANPGDHIVGTTLLGLPLDLGVVTDGIGQLLSGLCKVTVNVVDTVVAPAPVVGAPVASAVNGTVSSTTNSLTSAIPSKQGRPPAQGKPAPGKPQKPGTGGSPSAPAGGTSAGTTPLPDSTSPVLTGGFLTAPNYGELPFNFTTGYAPMRDYSTIPMVNAGLYSPSPGLRYGGQVPGYAPEFGILGQDGTTSSGAAIQNAGQADALPGPDEPADGVGLPVLIAVLSLSGVSAGLVRTWVLRRMAATA